MVLRAKLAPEEVEIDSAFEEEVDEEEEEVGAEDEGEEGVEDGGEADELNEVGVLGGEVEQAEEHEHLHRLRQVEVHADVLALEGLAVDGEAEVSSVDGGDADDSVERGIVGDGDDEGDEELLEAAEEPEVLGDGLVVGADEVDGRREGVVPHPLRFDHLLLRLQQQQHQHRHLHRQEQRRAEGARRRERRTECQVGHLREDVDVDLDQREVEEDYQEVEPQHVVQAVHHPVDAYPLLLPPLHLVPLRLPGHLADLRLAQIVPPRLPRRRPGQLGLDDRVLLAPLEPPAEELDEDREGEDGEEDDHPGELVGEEVGRLPEDAVLAEDVLRISGGNGVIGGDVEERTHGDVLESVRADVKAVERGEEHVELLWEVEVDEHDQRELLHVLDRLVQEVLHALHEDRERGQHQRRDDEAQDQPLVARVEGGGGLADPLSVLVRVRAAVAHPVNGSPVVPAVHPAGRAGEVVLGGTAGSEAAVVAGLPGRQAQQQQDYYQFHYPSASSENAQKPSPPALPPFRPSIQIGSSRAREASFLALRQFQRG